MLNHPFDFTYTTMITPSIYETTCSGNTAETASYIPAFILPQNYIAGAL